MENPQHSLLSSRISVKALQKQTIKKNRIIKNLRFNDQLVMLRKSVGNSNQASLQQSPRSISSFLQESNTSTLQGSSKDVLKSKKRRSFFQRTLQTMCGQRDLESTLSSPKWAEQKQQFTSNLRRFSMILSNQTIQNHSPKKQTIKGAQQLFDHTKLQMITKRNLKTLEPSLKPRQIIKKRRRYTVNQSLNLPQIYLVNQQSKKQKQAFYQMHPYFLKKDNSKMLERRADKRYNLMALQDLYIRTRNKQTSRIYKKI